MMHLVTFWEWLSSVGIDVSSVLSGGGIVTVLGLMLGDRLVTKGRLLRDLKTQHDFYESLLKERADNAAAVAASEARRYADVVAARDGYKAAVDVERARADRVQDQLGEANETARAMLHVIQSLDEAAGSMDDGQTDGT